MPRKRKTDKSAFPVTRALACMLSRSGAKSTPSEAAQAAPKRWGFDVRSNPFVALFAASLIALLPSHAAAQGVTGAEGTPNPDNSISVRERPRPELDPQGVRLGGFTLFGTLGFDVTSTDNLFASPAPEQDDLIYTGSADVNLISNWSRHRINLSAGGASLMHDDFDSEDVETYYGSFYGRIDATNNTSFVATARASHDYVPRTDPDLSVVGSPVEYDTAEATLGVTHRFGRFTARADVAQEERQYDGVESYRDYDVSSARLRADVELSPRIGVLIEGRFDERDYDDPATPLDSEGVTALVGATFRGDLMHGEVSVGHFERDYDNAAIGSVDGLAVAGELEWYVTQLTTLTFNARRGSSDNASVGALDSYVTTEFGAQVDHELQRNLIVTAGVRSGEREYESTNRNDEYLNYEVGADYWLNRRVALQLRYEHSDVDSTVPSRNFEVNAVTGGIRLRL